MKLTIIHVAIIAVLCLVTIGETKPQQPQVVAKLMTSKLDHFDPHETRTWQMRFLTNEEYFVDGGPIFIYLGGTMAVQSYWIRKGNFHDIAKEHHGYLVIPENRYFGESIPTPDLSTPNLKYLSISQTLADVALLIHRLKADNPKLARSKVIIGGGSYGGSLAVWFSYVYPELVSATLASSAPLLAKADFYEKSEVIGETIRTLGSQRCYNRIENGIYRIKTLVANNQSDAVAVVLNLCNGFDGSNELNVASLFAVITAAFSSYAVYGNNNSIANFCNRFMAYPDDLSAMVRVLSWSRNNNPNCMDISFRETINQMNNIRDFSRGSRQWAYLTCNELGWFQTSSSMEQPFGSNTPISLYATICAELFGNKYTQSFIEQNMVNFNNLYKGRNLTARNLRITYGEFDSWRPVGSIAMGPTTIAGATVFSDQKSISEDDARDVKEAKEESAQFIRNLLA